MLSTSQTFLLRCQSEGDTVSSDEWRFILEAVHGETERRGFVDIEALLAHIREVLLDLTKEIEETTNES